MFENLRKWMGMGSSRPDETGVRAATTLVEQPPKPPKNKPRSLVSIVRSATPDKTADLPKTARRIANTDILSLRARDDAEFLRTLVQVTPDLSSARSAYLRTALPQNYTALARNTDGTFNREATQLLQQILTRIELATDYSQGFTGIWTLRSLCEAFATDILLWGGCSSELVLDSARLPTRIQPVSFNQITFGTDKERLYPRQKTSGGDPIDLNQPTFFITVLDQELLEPYPGSPLEAAVQAVMADTDFFNDLRRIVKRAFFPRLDVSIDLEMFLKTVPDDVKLNPEALRKYTEDHFGELAKMVNALNPEDAFIHFDHITPSYMTHERATPGQEAVALQTMARGRVASGAKALPSILGVSGASQNVASTESMLFLKNADGMIRMKVNEHMSRMLTLALRLFGQEVYAEFKFDEISLRPDIEIEAFRVMKQDRLLSLLSLGFISDDEASIQLTGNVTPLGFKPLSGTGFQSGSIQVNDSPYSTTGSSSDKQGAQNETLAPKTPTKAKGKA